MIWKYPLCVVKWNCLIELSVLYLPQLGLGLDFLGVALLVH